jgi:hypothetical protein
VKCEDLKAPMRGYKCGPCPPGFLGNGKHCKEEGETPLSHLLLTFIVFVTFSCLDIMVSPIKQAPIHVSLEEVGARGGIQTLDHRILSRVFYHCAGKANNMKGRESTVNRALDGSIYPG